MSEDQLTLYGSEKQQSIENFQKLLNLHPHKSEVKTNDQAKGAKYLSIGTIERLLDENFSGLWSTENFRWEVVCNEIVGSIDLKVFNPAVKTWITRTGSASTMILTVSGKPATVENKIKNTLVKDFPHLKAECIKNAAKTLGVRFGRNLNRNQEDEPAYLSESLPELSGLQQDAFDLLKTCTLSDDYKEKVSKKILRATNQTLTEIITYLKQNQ
jgi:hypothetical protein